MAGSTAPRSTLDPRRATRRLRGLVEGVGFWTAVFLPFLYLPSLILGSLVPVSPTIVGLAVGLNVLALLVGHRHEPNYPQG